MQARVQAVLAGLQPLGRALMLPIAVLPVAGLLLRLGQPDLLGLGFVAAAGNAIFANLGLLFAIGVAVGLARESHGAAGLGGAVAFLVATEGAKALMTVPAPPHLDAATTDAVITAAKAAAVARLAVPAGIVSGLAGGMLYNRFADIRLPEYLAFFGGRRFVPIAAGGFGVVLAAVLGMGYPALAAGIDAISRWVVGAGDMGLFIYGLLNRLLLVTGLHHIINNMVWFIVGDYHGKTGDLNRFFAGDPGAGAFMSGFFPVMMFGLPAACLAMYRTALPERRAEVAGLYLSLAATSFLTGVTEPIEFTFMFLAPVLYVIHAVLTGVAMVVMHELGVHLGFGFSAGLLDYVLNFRLATRPLWLLPVGAAYAAIYYGVFRFCIVRLDLATPGRRADGPVPVATGPVDARAAAFIAALGGAGNLRGVDACTTRLRLVLTDPAVVDEAALTALGVRGVVRPGGGAVQVVIGPTADTLAVAIRAALGGGAIAVRVPLAPVPAPVPPPVPIAAPGRAAQVGDLVRACGGGANMVGAVVCGSRVLLRLRDRDVVDAAGLGLAAPRGWAWGPGELHVIVGAEAPGVALALADMARGGA